MRLEADMAPVERYVDAAIELKMPLYLGIGAARLDRNSTSDLAKAKLELHASARQRVRLINRVSEELEAHGNARSSFPWPGDLYIEDTNGETNIELIRAVLDGTDVGNQLSVS